MSERITVEALVQAPLLKSWESYTKPEHVMAWNHASDDWHCPRAESDLRPGGAFSFRMESKDGSQGFDFAGVYDEVSVPHRISYTFGDRKAIIEFSPEGETTRIVVSFDPEGENPVDMQRAGWQAILDNYARYTAALD